MLTTRTQIGKIRNVQSMKWLPRMISAAAAYPTNAVQRAVIPVRRTIVEAVRRKTPAIFSA